MRKMDEYDHEEYAEEMITHRGLKRIRGRLARLQGYHTMDPRRDAEEENKLQEILERYEGK